MALTGVAPIKQAFVQTLRANSTLKAAVNGGFYEGEAPRGVKMPFLTYHVAYAPFDYLWGSAMLRVGFDVFIIAENGVAAGNIDALVLTTLHDAALSVNGQTTLICRRVADVVIPPYLSEEGKRIHQVGGTYEVWTDQPL
jgi:hypothetical protein